MGVSSGWSGRVRLAFAQISTVRKGKLGSFAADKLRRAVWSRVDRRHVLFRLDPKLLPAVSSLEGDVRRFDRIESLPDEAFEFMPLSWFADRFDEGARLWSFWTGNRPVACLWAISGRELNCWYVRIRPQDCVIYAVVTYPPMRGRGIARELLSYVAACEMNGENDIFLDCMRWNLTAQRSFERVGFRRFAITAYGPVIPVCA